MSEHTNPTETFDALAPDYDRLTRWGEWLVVRGWRHRLLRGVRGRVLEIGVGTGANFPHYPVGVTLFGVDVSEGMLARAKARAEALGLDVYLNVADAAALPFPDDAFDVVVSTLTLCSLVAPDAALAEVARVCAPEGRVLLLEHGRSRLAWINRWLDRIAPRHQVEFGCRPNLDIEALVRAAPLRVAHIRRRFFGVLKAFEAAARK